MAEQHLQVVFSKVPAAKEIKSMVKFLINNLQEKTLTQLRLNLLNQGTNPKPKFNTTAKANSTRLSNLRHQSLQSKTESLQTAENTKDFISKLKKDQKARSKRQHQREAEEKARAQVEDHLLQAQHAEAAAKAEEAKAQRLQVLQQKSSKRKQEVQNLIEIGKQEYKKVLNSKPLHQLIQENYLSKVLMPELERHKLELARKRENFQPISRSVILEHAKKHDQIIQEHEIQKRNQSQENHYDAGKLRSKFTLAYIEEQKKRRLGIEKERLEKKNLAEKKKNYAELVLEMYQPTVDPAKRLELRLIREKVEAVGVARKKRTARSLDDGDCGDLVKKKWKKKPLVEKIVEKKQKVVVDWLGQQRKKRDNRVGTERVEDWDWDDTIGKEEMRRKLEIMEKEMRKKEMKLVRAKVSDLEGIEEIGDVGNMLIRSIKGKLAILEG